MIDELNDYLEQQAARVRVDDTLDDIETGLTLVPVDRQRRRPRWALPALIGATAAAIAFLGVTATNRPATSTVTPAASVGGQPADGEAPSPAVDVTTPASTTPASVPALLPEPPAAAVDVTAPAANIPAPVPAPLPDGATIQGFTPLCTTTDGIEFDCTIDGYRHAGGYNDGGIDHTGEAQAVITAGSVSGGCRSTSPDGSTWRCALGQRAVDLAMIGPTYLGQSQTPGYTAG